MRLGVMSDVHGNRVALEAVVADGIAAGVDAWWALGDLVAIGPDPVATLELLVDLPNLVATSGNTERYVLTGDRPRPTPAEVAVDPALLGLFAEVCAPPGTRVTTSSRRSSAASRFATPRNVRARRSSPERAADGETPGSHRSRGVGDLAPRGGHDAG